MKSEVGGWILIFIRQSTTKKMENMYSIIVIFFFPSGTSLRARTFVPNVGWGGHNSTVGVTLPEVWARSVQCVARGKLLNFFGLERT